MCYILCHIQRTPGGAEGAEVDVEQEFTSPVLGVCYPFYYS